MKVHVVCINLRDCEGVIRPEHDKCWLKGDIDWHFYEVTNGEATLDTYQPGRHDDFVVAEIAFDAGKQETNPWLVTIKELRAVDRKRRQARRTGHVLITNAQRVAWSQTWPAGIAAGLKYEGKGTRLRSTS